MSLEVFISYAPEDRKLRDKLVKHLSTLRNEKMITDWDKGKIIAGTESEQQILAHLHTAQIILLLISPDFLNSSFCYSTEMNYAITRHDHGEACVIPIILRPTDWKGAPFAKLRALPTDEKPVIQWHPQDEAFKNVAEGIRRAVEEWQARTPPNPLNTHPIELPRVDDILDGQLAASTIAMYRRDIAAYDKFAKTEGLKPCDPKTVYVWRDEMVHHSTKSPKTINRMLSAVRWLFNEAAQRDMVESGLAAKFERVPGVKEKALKERLKQHSQTRISPEYIRRLCESPNVKTLVGIRDRALLATLASSGIKASELASLTKSQIMPKDGGYQLSVRGNTDIDYRDAALSPEAYRLIQTWLESRSSDSEYVFTAFAGKGDRPLETPISESGLWKVVVKYAKKMRITLGKTARF